MGNGDGRSAPVGCDIRLLGGVELRGPNGPLDLGHRRQKTVFALLAVHNDTMVSATWLIEQLWGAGAPQRAVNTLYSYLSRLRKVLATVPGVELVRATGGYLLRVAPEAVDLHRFRGLVSRARITGAVADWDAALALWHGEPFAGLDAPLLDETRATVDSERLVAVLERLDALLTHGEHARALPQLRAFTAEHPWDERLAGQFMLALYRSGRASEALDHYRDLATRLIAERGTEPGAALTELHRTMLADDPGLRPVPTATVPRQLPGAVADFTGRGPQLEQLDLLLSQDVRTVVVTGTAGAGKTSLALHWAHRVAAEFPDGQLYVDLRGFDPESEPLPGAEVVRGFLDALGVDPRRQPETLAARTAMFRTLVADRRLLVLLDNARDAEQVRPLLPGGSGCLTLVTSRDRLAGLVATEGARPVPVRELPEAEARVLLETWVGANRVKAEYDVVTELIRRCGGLPLALSILAARAEATPSGSLAPLLRELGAATDGLSALDAADPKADVRGVFSWSYRWLSPPAARLFRLLGCHPGPGVSATAAASLLGEPLATVRPLLAELTGAHLLTRDRVDRYGCHDLLRGYARELAATTEADRRAATVRLLDQYTHSARRAWLLWDGRSGGNELPEPVPGVVVDTMTTADEAKAWFDTEEPVLVALAMLANRDGFHDRAHRLVRAMERMLEWRGRWVAWLACQHLALESATRCEDPAAQAHALMFLGHADIRRGNLPEAEVYFNRSLELSQQAADAYGRIQSHVGLGMTYKRQGRHALALEHELFVCELYRDYGEPGDPGRMFALNNLGLTYSRTGDHGQALRYCNEALELGTRYHHSRAVAAALGSLGSVHAGLGDWAAAIDHLERAVVAEGEFGDVFAEADALAKLGDVLHEMGDTGAAVARYRQSMAILDSREADGSQSAAETRAKLWVLERTVAGSKPNHDDRPIAGTR